MKILLSTGVKRTAILNLLLFDAVSHSAVDCAKVLLDMGADANSQFGEEKLTPLMHAKQLKWLNFYWITMLMHVILIEIE